MSKFIDNDNTKKPIAVMPLTNTASMFIYDIIYGIDDEIEIGVATANKKGELSKEKIEYDEDRPYFQKDGIKYYIDEFIKI